MAYGVGAAMVKHLPRIYEPPTERQFQVLQFIYSYNNEFHRAPSIREIRDHLVVGGTNGVNDHLVALERRRLIHRDSMKSRTILITEAGLLALGIQPTDETTITKLREENARLQRKLDAIRDVLQSGTEGEPR